MPDREVVMKLKVETVKYRAEDNTASNYTHFTTYRRIYRLYTDTDYLVKEGNHFERDILPEMLAR